MRLSAWVWGLLLLSGAGAGAIEGTLSKDAAAKIAEIDENFGLVGSFEMAAIVKEFNTHRVLPIGLDSRLMAKKIPKIEFKGVNLKDCIDTFAKELQAKAYVLGHFILITEKLPAGVLPHGAGPITTAEALALNQIDAHFPGIAPGQYRRQPWVTLSPADCLALQKPIILYVVDSTMAEDNPSALFFELIVLSDPQLSAQIAGFTCCLVDTSSTTWPPAILERAKGGSAVFLLTCDASVKAMWDKKGPKLNSPLFLDGLKVTTAANQSVAARQQKKKDAPPPQGNIPAPKDPAEKPKKDPPKPPQNQPTESE